MYIMRTLCCGDNLLKVCKTTRAQLLSTQLKRRTEDILLSPTQSDILLLL